MYKKCIVIVGKSWYREEEIPEISIGSGEYEVVVQAENWFSCIEGE